MNGESQTSMADSRMILIIEDTRVHRELMKYELQDHYKLHFAYDSQMAQKYLNENSYDLVIIDTFLPPQPEELPQSGEGLRILQEIRALASHVPVEKTPAKILVVSAYLGDEERREIKASGVEKIFEKPFSLDEFKEYIDHLWDDDSHGPLAS